jgi:transcription elongation factor GreA
MEARVRQLQGLLKTAKIVDEEAAAGGTVALGSLVQLRYEGDEDPEAYLVGSIEERREGVTVVSPSSPLGQALLDHQPGDTVEYESPGGSLKVEIVKVGE